MHDLEALAQSIMTSGPFAFCGIGVSRVQDTQFYTATADGIIADENSVWRAASISKIVTGRVAERAFRAAGKEQSTVEDLLGVPFRAHDGTAPTPAQLASHQAGITDAAGYVIPAGASLIDWLATAGDGIWSGAKPGAQFEYSNLGFILLAACAECAAGARFDSLAHHTFLKPTGLNASFNCSQHGGVPHVLPTFRRQPDGQFAAQIDAPPTAPDLPTPYVMGSSPHIFSPQGGLRISLRHLTSLGHTLKDHPTHDAWAADPTRTVGPPDVFQSYAWGAQIFYDPAFYPRPLIGHFANAYGFCGGLWWDAAADLTFAYALNGLAVGDEDDGLCAQERAVFDAIAQTA